jgi:quercetin dioxygenase-like cupin family protein
MPSVAVHPNTAWHTHPLGQTLIITSGLGWIQREGRPTKKSDDVIWVPPGLKHWHGATAMMHISPFRKCWTAEMSTGLKRVSDEQYRG